MRGLVSTPESRRARVEKENVCDRLHLYYVTDRQLIQLVSVR